MMLVRDTLRYELPVEGNSLLGYIVRRMHKTAWLEPVGQLIETRQMAQALAHIAAYAVSASTSFGRAHYQPTFDEPGAQVTASDPATGAAVTARLVSTKPHYQIACEVRMPDGAVLEGTESITGTTIGLRGLGMPAPSKFTFRFAGYEANLKGLLTSELVLSLFGNTRIRAYGRLELADNAGNSGSIQVERSGRAHLLVNGKDIVLEDAAAAPAAQVRMTRLDPETGRQALRSLIRERSLLGPLTVLYRRVGRFFQVPLPSFHPFVVGGASANRQVLVSDRSKLLWRNPDPVTDVLRRGLLVVDGDEHDSYRGLMEPLLHPGALSQYSRMMVEQADRVSSRWQDGQIVDMLVEGRKIALLVVMQGLFGVDAWDDLPRIWKPMLGTIRHISPGIWILWRRIPRPGFRRNLAVLDDYLYGIIRARRAKGGGRDLLQHLVDAGLDDGRIRDQMLTMLIAGHDTSTALLAWTFYLLGTHPQVHARLVREVRAAMGNNAPTSSGGWQPPLLDQVIKESLRLYPPIHIGNRIAQEQIELEDGRIPAGARMFYSIYLTHRDPEYWDEPERFRPERFAGGRKAPPFAYVPFGGGPRACIGSSFGQAEGRLVLGRLLQTHDFEYLKQKVHAHMGATLEPSPGVRLRVRRNRAVQA